MELKLKTFNTARTVRLDDTVTRESLNAFKADIEKIINEDEDIVRENQYNLSILDKHLAEEYKKNVKFPAITLDITSPGGYVLEGLAIHDVLRSLNDEGKHPVECVMSGCIASMATFIVLGCDVRKVHKNTSFCVHSIGDMEIGKIQKHRDNLEEMERLSKRCHDIYYKQTKLTKEQVEDVDKLQKDWWFDADEALKLGFATEII